jgi:hypothetical protein
MQTATTRIPWLIPCSNAALDLSKFDIELLYLLLELGILARDRRLELTLVGIKSADSKVNITVLVPASATLFGVPKGVLSPGQKYKLSIGTVVSNGNTSFVETTFTTAN